MYANDHSRVGRIVTKTTPFSIIIIINYVLGSIITNYFVYQLIDDEDETCSDLTSVSHEYSMLSKSSASVRCGIRLNFTSIRFIYYLKLWIITFWQHHDVNLFNFSLSSGIRKSEGKISCTSNAEFCQALCLL